MNAHTAAACCLAQRPAYQHSVASYTHAPKCTVCCCCCRCYTWRTHIASTRIQRTHALVRSTMNIIQIIEDIRRARIFVPCRLKAEHWVRSEIRNRVEWERCVFCLCVCVFAWRRIAHTSTQADTYLICVCVCSQDIQRLSEHASATQCGRTFPRPAAPPSIYAIVELRAVG